MSIDGWYYQHVNGDLIYKKDYDGTRTDFLDSDFVVAFWPMDVQDRSGAWDILVEALAGGANKERVNELAVKWMCDDVDADKYATYIGIKLYKDGAQWCATRQDFKNIQESPAGFGDTKLEAMAELAKALGYEPTKIWSAHFKDIVK